MQGFDTFGRQHLLWLLALMLAGAAVLVQAPSKGDGNAAARKGLFPGSGAAAILALLGRVVPGIFEIAEGSYGIASLPLHVCSLAGYGCFLHFLLTAGQKKREARRGKEAGEQAPVLRILSELLYCPGLPGAFLALLFPGWGYLPAFSLLSAWEFLGHFGIVLYVLLSLKSGTIAPSDLRIPLIFCALYAAVMFPFDLCTGMNYGFLLLPAPDSPLSAIAGQFGGGIGYAAGYGILVLLLTVLFYLPFRKNS